MEEVENPLFKVEPTVEIKPVEINPVCLNCNTPLTDIFCVHCGQKNIPRRQGLGELIENFIGSFYSFESKFFKTTKYLLLKPGFLPEQYNAGKRESYYHPARACVFYYSEHLVFTIYFYNFLFLTSSIGLLSGFVPKLAWIQPWIVGWILIYLFLAMKRLYKQSWGKTLTKYFTFAIMFSICMIIGLMANLVVTLLVI